MLTVFFVSLIKKAVLKKSLDKIPAFCLYDGISINIITALLLLFFQTTWMFVWNE